MISPTSDGHSTMYAIGDWAAVNNGQPYVDSNGCWWQVTREEGWSGAPAARVITYLLPGLDGQRSANPKLQARSVVLGGTVRAPDQARLQTAMDQVSGLLAGPVREDTLAVAEAHLTRQAVVRRDGETQVAKVSPYTASWVLQLVADDPVRYSAVLHSASAALIDQSGGTGQLSFPHNFPFDFGGSGVGAGQMIVTNAGTETAYPMITIQGPGTNLRVDDQASGNYLLVTSLGVGQFVVLDTLLHEVLLNGYAPSRQLLAAGSEWFGLPPGTDALVFGAGAYTTASVSMTWRDAY